MSDTGSNADVQSRPTCLQVEDGDTYHYSAVEPDSYILDGSQPSHFQCGHAIEGETTCPMADLPSKTVRKLTLSYLAGYSLDPFTCNNMRKALLQYPSLLVGWRGDYQAANFIDSEPRTIDTSDGSISVAKIDPHMDIYIGLLEDDAAGRHLSSAEIMSLTNRLYDLPVSSVFPEKIAPLRDCHLTLVLQGGICTCDNAGYYFSTAASDDEETKERFLRSIFVAAEGCFEDVQAGVQTAVRCFDELSKQVDITSLEEFLASERGKDLKIYLSACGNHKEQMREAVRVTSGERTEA